MRIENTDSIILENKNIVWVNGKKAKIENYINDILSEFFQKKMSLFRYLMKCLMMTRCIIDKC